MPINSRISGLRDHAPAERLALVAEGAGIDQSDLDALRQDGGLSVAQADHMIENVVGLLSIPVGVATNFTIDGRDRLIPMATEEPSVVAAASNAARIARGHGGFTTSYMGDVMIAQIQVLDSVDPHGSRFALLEAKDELLALANEQDPMLVSLGGGAFDISVRVLPTRVGIQVILHLHVDVRDAMGANAVNTMAEAIAPRIAEIAGSRTLLRILTNKAELRVTRARAVFDAELLGGAQVVDDIVAASAFAEADPYRAATHNKGIMNGITAVVLATGNDTRAVESGCHSHAARSGQYSALSQFEKDADGNLVGTLEVPLAVGLVGAVGLAEAREPTQGCADHQRQDGELSTGFWAPAVTAARCVVPMRGYYEWTGEPGNKQAFFLHGPQPLLAAAGIYTARKVGDEWEVSTSIITREARDASGEVHDRMPVFLERDVWDDYLAPVKLDDAGKEEMVALLNSESEKVAATITNYEVDRRVNNSRTVDPEDPALIEPLE